MERTFDAHLHNKNHEGGGFIIGLEGTPFFDGVLSNDEALKLHNPNKLYFSFYYVTILDINKHFQHKYLKYHPRRERYTPKQVSKSIKINNPKAVIIDTLNEPFWSVYDYWKIARCNHEIPIIMAHAGGYLINDFIKMCHFQPNVWIDFALTHTVLGHLGDKEKELPYINEAIRYSLNSPFKKRVLMSSDFPFYNQDDVFEYYAEYHDLLNDNFLSLAEVIM